MAFWDVRQKKYADHARILLDRLGAKETVYHSNRHVFTSLFEDKEGRRMAFVLNLYSGRNETDLHIGDRTIEGIRLEPMEVKTICL